MMKLNKNTFNRLQKLGASVLYKLLPLIIAFSLSAHADNSRPILTTAGIVHACPQNKIVIIERGKNPFGYAMFGGHVEHESPIDAFIREAKEELNIDNISQLRLIGVHGKPGRDPRQHSVEITYSCVTHDMPIAGSDAKKVYLLENAEIYQLIKEKKFAFDHGEILAKYLDSLSDCNPCQSQCNVGIEAAS